MSGIERERVVNKDLLELFGEYINCFVCRMIIKDPFSCEECEACCCKVCFNNEFKCKKCKSSRLTFFPSVFRNFLFALKVNCKFCDMILEYNNIEEHEISCFETINPSNVMKHWDEANKNSFLNSQSYEKIEVSQEIVRSYVNVEGNIDEVCNKKEIINKELSSSCINVHKEDTENNVILIKELNGEYENKEINDFHSLFSDNIEDKHCKTYSNFMDSLQSNNSVNMNENQMIPHPKKIDLEDPKDYEIKCLSNRVANLEKLCSSLINEAQSMRNSIRLFSSLHPTNYVPYTANLPKSSHNPNFVSQKGTIVFDSCNICTKITNVKLQLRCLNCQKNVCPECYYECQKCGEVSCKSCGKCSLCKEIKFCYKCKHSCAQCIKNKNMFGEECIRSCEVCEKENRFCKRCCNFKCKECGKISCLGCIWNCKKCYLNFCVKHPNEDCKICGIKLCRSCSKMCADCGRIICEICLFECKKCSKNVCKSCCINFGKENLKACKVCLNDK
jgi:hypothetical protein